MANIRPYTAADGSVCYKVQIRLKGYPPQFATFARKTDAKHWAADTESAIRAGRHFSSTDARRHTLADLCDRYIERVLPAKSRSMQRDQTHQLNWWKARLGHYALAHLTPTLIAEQRDYLTRHGLRVSKRMPPRPLTAATVVRYLAALSAACSTAVKEWGWLEANPVAKVKKPREAAGRARFLTDDECARLLTACRNNENRYLYPVVLLAISTGARHGEIMQLRWRDIDFERGRAILPNTKNGDRRTLFLSAAVLTELDRLKQGADPQAELVFPSERVPAKPMALRKVWLQAMKTAEVENFRFHDLRHTAASYLAMNGATLTELSEILGHRTLAMVKRYAHLSDSHVRRVVNRMNMQLLPATQAGQEIILIANS